MAVTVTTNYSGELLEGIIARARTGLVTVQGNHINVVNNAVAHPYIPRIKASNIFQPRAATPTDGGTIDFTEKKITLGDLMVYLEVNPQQFEQYWRRYQPEGQMVFRELPGEIQRAMMDEVMRLVAEDMETKIWQGDTASSTQALTYFDGLIKLMENDATVVDVTSPVTLTNSNIDEKLAAVYSAAPQAVRTKPDFKYYVNDNTATLWTEWQENQTYKGPLATRSGEMTFRNHPIVVSPGLPDDTIVGAVGNLGMGSNLHYAIDWDLNSMSNVALFERKQANSELFFIKMLFKAGVQFGWGEEIVLYKA